MEVFIAMCIFAMVWAYRADKANADEWRGR